MDVGGWPYRKSISRRLAAGIETKYHEHAVDETAPYKTTRWPRYEEITERSGIFRPGWSEAVCGTALQQVWRDHLLVLAMLQSDDWSFGRYVLVHPAANPSFAELGVRYRELLVDDSTFEVRTIEDLLDIHVLHGSDLESAFRTRYLFT